MLLSLALPGGGGGMSRFRARLESFRNTPPPQSVHAPFSRDGGERGIPPAELLSITSQPPLLDHRHSGYRTHAPRAITALSLS